MREPQEHSEKLLNSMNLNLSAWQQSEDFMKGYAAGFFDGEGCVQLLTSECQGERPSPTISIANRHLIALQYLHAYVFPLLGIDFLYPRNGQIRISRWESIEAFVEVFKDICVVKRRQLQLMDEAVKLHKSLVRKRKGKRIYSEEALKKFKQIDDSIGEDRKLIVNSESLFPHHSLFPKNGKRKE